MAQTNKSPLVIAKEVFLDARKQAMVAVTEVTDVLKKNKDLNEVWEHQLHMAMNALNGSIEKIRNAEEIIRDLKKKLEEQSEKLKNCEKNVFNAKEKLKDASKKLQVLMTIPTFAPAA
jgi:chromosome segregation ATPase|mmetsp:Transcript_22881/g.32783  ORF Transcript_22881/g.32783 Transcript_22881/m.32783 type:complete len:118 (-) Transcript_22881:2430-2783(-)